MEIEERSSFPTPPFSPPPASSIAGAISMVAFSQDLDKQDAVPRSSSADPFPNGRDVDDDLQEAEKENSAAESLLYGDSLTASGDLQDQSLQGGPMAPSAPAVLTDELRDQIVRQVEYYFSDENLPTDKFLLKYVKKDKKGFVPIAVIASFRRMKKLTDNLSFMETALRTSSQLVVSADGKKVKRLHPLTATETCDKSSCTVVVENLPEDCSTDYIRRVFGKLGNIANIALHDPKPGKPGIVISNKVYALVQYETIEAAENAVSSLNDEKNWRSGMHVQILLKRMGKYGVVHKGHKGTYLEKNNDVQVAELAMDEHKMKSVDHGDEMAKKEDQEQVKGSRSRRYKGRGRGHIQSSVNEHGHGGVLSGSSGEYNSKPVAGPKMPDGTRGFTMGRGKPTIC